MMRPRALAALHARCFVTPRPWTEAEFEAQIADPKTHLVGDGPGFALSRVVLDEAELLTLAVDPPSQGMGHGTALLEQIETISADHGAKRMFLEVSAENGAAQVEEILRESRRKQRLCQEKRLRRHEEKQR